MKTEKKCLCWKPSEPQRDCPLHREKAPKGGLGLLDPLILLFIILFSVTIAWDNRHYKHIWHDDKKDAP